MKLSTSRNAHRRGSAAVVVILVLVIAIVVGGCIWLVMTRRPSDQQPGRLTAEAEAYFPFMSMNGFDMKATESFSQHQLVEITGKVTNKGNREVKTVDAVCLFYDPYGKALHRERVNVLKPRDGPLKPGETRAFRMAFDTIPQGWNQAFPQIGIAEMTFVH